MMMKIRREKTVLLVIDMQNGDTLPDGIMGQKLGFDMTLCNEAIPGCKRLIQVARAVSVPVMFTRYVYQPDFKDGGIIVREIMPEIMQHDFLVEGSWDAEILDELKPLEGEAVINKNRPSAFYSTALESYLRSMRIEDLVVCGVTTNMCVECTVRDAAQRDYRTFVVRDAVGEVDRDRHFAALKSMEYLFARVVDVSDVEKAWKVKLEDVA